MSCRSVAQTFLQPEGHLAKRHAFYNMYNYWVHKDSKIYAARLMFILKLQWHSLQKYIFTINEWFLWVFEGFVIFFPQFGQCGKVGQWCCLY
jgi:hypothetical protein